MPTHPATHAQLADRPLAVPVQFVMDIDDETERTNATWKQSLDETNDPERRAALNAEYLRKRSELHEARQRAVALVVRKVVFIKRTCRAARLARVVRMPRAARPTRTARRATVRRVADHASATASGGSEPGEPSAPSDGRGVEPQVKA